MRGVWVQTGDSPTVYRYIDWLITVPLQMVEFYLILAAVRRIPSGIFWRLLIGSLVMLIGGYLRRSRIHTCYVRFRYFYGWMDLCII